MPKRPYTDQEFKRDRAFLERVFPLNLPRLPSRDLISLLQAAGHHALRTGSGETTPLGKCTPQRLYSALQTCIRTARKKVDSYVPQPAEPSQIPDTSRSSSVPPSIYRAYPFLSDGIESLVRQGRLSRDDLRTCDWLDYASDPGVDN